MKTPSYTRRQMLFVGIVSVLLAGQFAGAEPKRQTTPHSPPLSATEQKERNVYVKVGDLVSVAIGKEASVTTQIGNPTGQTAPDTKVIVEVDRLIRQAIGPKASVCLVLPSDDAAHTCD